MAISIIHPGEIMNIPVKDREAFYRCLKHMHPLCMSYSPHILRACIRYYTESDVTAFLRLQKQQADKNRKYAKCKKKLPVKTAKERPDRISKREKIKS